MEIFIFFGPPGAGKGTQAKIFAKRHNLQHVSTGELLREEISKDSQLGREASQHINGGNLAPDNIAINLIKEIIKTHKDCPGFVFDGFPRTIVQAEALEEIVKENKQLIKAVICLEVNEQELIKRLLNRAKQENRPDDTENVIANRLDIYRRLTAPLLFHYQKQNKLINIDGQGDIIDIENRINKEIEKIK